LPGVKRQGRETDHSPPTSAEVKKMWIYTSTPPYVFMALSTETTLTFTLLQHIMFPLRKSLVQDIINYNIITSPYGILIIKIDNNYAGSNCFKNFNIVNCRPVLAEVANEQMRKIRTKFNQTLYGNVVPSLPFALYVRILTLTHAPYRRVG
jgi:hypothetical protein